jgi:hypothetical protein
MDRARPTSPVEARPGATPDEAEGGAHAPSTTPPHGDPTGDRAARPPHAPIGKDTPPGSGSDKSDTGHLRDIEPEHGRS